MPGPVRRFRRLRAARLGLTTLTSRRSETTAGVNLTAITGEAEWGSGHPLLIRSASARRIQ